MLISWRVVLAWSTLYEFQCVHLSVSIVFLRLMGTFVEKCCWQPLGPPSPGVGATYPRLGGISCCVLCPFRGLGVLFLSMLFVQEGLFLVAPKKS